MKHRFRTLPLWLICVFTMFCQQAFSQILIMVPVFNRPEFIELQYKAFKKFLKDDYTLVMFNDADNETMQHRIEEMCLKYEIPCIRVPQTVHNVDPLCYKAPASFRHGEVLQFAFGNYGFKHDDLVAVVDSDMFLIKEFSIRKYIEGYDLDGYGGLMITHFGVFDMPKLKNPETISFKARFLSNGHFIDVAHDTPYYLEAHQNELKVKQVDILWGVHRDLHVDRRQNLTPQLSSMGYDAAEIDLIKAVFDETERAARANPSKRDQILYDCDIGFYETNVFLDYKHGSCWHNPGEMQQIKDRLVMDFLRQRLN